jgi:hypothetical protein
LRNEKGQTLLCRFRNLSVKASDCRIDEMPILFGHFFDLDLFQSTEHKIISFAEPSNRFQGDLTMFSHWRINGIDQKGKKPFSVFLQVGNEFDFIENGLMERMGESLVEYLL